MLRKMLKYDIQAMSKTFIPFFIAILVISIFSALSMHLEWLIGIFGGATILFGLGIALFVTSLVLIITQFYKNVLGDQGYLTNTLPVSVDTTILMLVGPQPWVPILSCPYGSSAQRSSN